MGKTTPFFILDMTPRDETDYKAVGRSENLEGQAVNQSLWKEKDYERPVRKSPLLHGQKSTPTPKFCLPHRPKFSDFFDLSLHWVSVVRVLRQKFAPLRPQFLRTWTRWTAGLEGNWTDPFQFYGPLKKLAKTNGVTLSAQKSRDKNLDLLR